MTAPRLVVPVGESDHIDGPADAPITLVEYGDFECPFCGMAYPILNAVRRKLRGQIRFVYRHFPLKESHPHAYHAAEASEAAADQGKFWEMHALLFENQHALEDQDLARYAGSIGIDPDRVVRALEEGTYVKRVRDDFRQGVRSGVNGTPTFFVNGERYDGTWTDQDAFTDALRSMIPAGR